MGKTNRNYFDHCSVYGELGKTGKTKKGTNIWYISCILKQTKKNDTETEKYNITNIKT